ncbi:type II toxin-antitoxin system HicB family antitoxin [Sphingomonas histidinilytica]|jgi:predicted RNase H-like HicB family nuclease|uniref:Predicted nuclease of the RNAse H fold, HicB family n=1 Tax=Rhizorhabdus histidinilytica TaxID=439228 RepID=A0A1T4ZWS7_9SPHN|nr:type II toxin-antitoxin system HicB family antitoxin [Rhizorhabdus histidinilytica]MBO9377519.1 type II toxin-antitoxin system HicB family antitoxin [Rhizorhabdus histidinilytica]QEH78578.1 type II toxin-antitoxin system HicB family antitoxin [Sphingomonas sp. C8-2]SKB26813.1 Predicted nuclease of the RNAse H fold, HicB family [Rhizorhabdus histidinilytica]
MGIYIRGLDFYPAVVSREDGVFRADFVDIPGCRAYGATTIEVERNARQALGVHMSTLARFGRTLPAPSVVGDRGRAADRYLVYIEGPERIDAARLPERKAA